MGIKLIKTKLACVKEVYYACGTHPELDLLLYDYYHLPPLLDDIWRQYNYAWLIYLDLPDKKQLISINTFFDDERKKLPKVKFNERLTSLQEINFSSLLYICTLYQQTSEPAMASKIFTKYKGNYNKLLKACTAYSYGRIVYKHQAAYLYGLLTGCTEAEAAIWVNEMCYRKRLAYAKANMLQIEKNTTLRDIWDNMTLQKTLYKANWNGAEILLHHLINK